MAKYFLIMIVMVGGVYAASASSNTQEYNHKMMAMYGQGERSYQQWEGECTVVRFSANDWAVCENDAGEAVLHENYNQFVNNLQ